MGEIRYWCFANKQIFSGLEIYHFLTAVGNVHASAFLRNKPKFLSSNEGMHAYSFLFDKQKTTSEKDKNKPQKLGRFEIFFRGLIATFWHSRSHKIEFAVWGLLA